MTFYTYLILLQGPQKYSNQTTNTSPTTTAATRGTQIFFFFCIQLTLPYNINNSLTNNSSMLCYRLSGWTSWIPQEFLLRPYRFT